MINRDDKPAVNGHSHACDAPPRSLRDKLTGVGSTGVRRDRFHFPTLKRLCLPPRDLAPRFAPNL